MTFVLNVAPIDFIDTVLQAEVFDYDNTRLHELREQNRGSYLVRREGNQIVCIPLGIGLMPLGGTPKEIQLSANLSLVAALAREAMYRHLLSKNCWLNKVVPISYLVPRRNILDECIPEHVSLHKGLGVYVQWEVDFRIFDPTGTSAFVGLCLNVRTAPRITIHCANLFRLGVPLVGFYAGRAYYGRNPDLKPRFTTVGRIVEVLGQGTHVRLEDVRGNNDSIQATKDLFLEPREDVLEHCIRYLYKQHASQIFVELERRTSAFHTGRNKHTRFESALKSFQGLALELVPRVPFSIQSFLTDALGKATIPTPLKAPFTTFVFAPGGQKIDAWNDQGLRRYGPYSRDNFTPSKPRICIICQASKKGQVEQVIRKFLDGIARPAGVEASNEYTGLKAKYHLQGCSIEFFLTANDTAEAYHKATSEALRHMNEGSYDRWDLALVQLDRSFRLRHSNANPYLITKARFIGQQIPVQEFTLEALSVSDARLTWVLNNMSLATYAKLNGVPWLLKADQPIAHEVVFGIGSAAITEGRFGGRERMIGITTVFTGDGDYFVSNVSSAVPEEDYFITLLDNLRSTMISVKRDLNWQPRDTVRLIFHAFKEFKYAEADAVKQVMSELGDYNVEYAFVHVAQDHPYLLFDTAQRGVGNTGKGEYAPTRGFYLSLSWRSMLVTLTGPRELKQAGNGLPMPVQLLLHRDSTFRDMTYLAKQVVNFAAHSWRGFHPSPMPVTVSYSQLVAKMLGQLAGVDQWNPDAILNRIGTTRWFL